MSAFLRLDGVTRRFGASAALDGVDIVVAKGDFTTLLGPSGSGKSTALMAIAGFSTPDAGRVLFEGRDITRLAPERRGFGVVFQGYALFPHLTVAENIAYPLRVRRLDRATVAEKVRRVLDLVQLSPFAERRPAMLSGGQQQRVAIARALVYEPPLLLLDEPLSALDRKLRGELQQGLKDLHARLGTTFVNVTHDQEEALALSTSVVVLCGGRVMQQGAPETVYREPASAFVADFVGESNLIAVSDVRLEEEGLAVGRSGGQPVRFTPRHALDAAGTALLSVRQEAIRFDASDEAGFNRLAARVEFADRVGPLLRLGVRIDAPGLVKITSPPRSRAPASGDALTISWPVADTIHVRA